MSHVPYEKQKEYRKRNLHRLTVDFTLADYERFKAVADALEMPFRRLIVTALNYYIADAVESRETGRETCLNDNVD